MHKGLGEIIPGGPKKQKKCLIFFRFSENLQCATPWELHIMYLQPRESSKGVFRVDPQWHICLQSATIQFAAVCLFGTEFFKAL